MSQEASDQSKSSSQHLQSDQIQEGNSQLNQESTRHGAKVDLNESASSQNQQRSDAENSLKEFTIDQKDDEKADNESSIGVKMVPADLIKRDVDQDMQKDRETRSANKLQGYALFNCHGRVFYLDQRSLYIFDHRWKFRNAIVWVVEWRVFQIFILLAVIGNSVQLASHNYENRIDDTLPASTDLEQTLSKVFVVIFIIEFILKVIAKGLIVKKHSYFRSAWNILDFICLLTAIMEQTPANVETFLMLRSLRVLKPLRSIKAMPSLQELVTSLLASLAGLLNVYLLLAFILSFCAILGVNLLNGYIYRACREQPELSYVLDEETGVETPVWPKLSLDLCNSNAVCQAQHPDYPNVVCGSIWHDHGLDPWQYDDVRENPQIFYGVPGFDYFSQALITVFQVCTLEGWSYITDNYSKASDYPFTVYIYFSVVVIIGSLFTMNLILAQIIITFDKQKTKISEERRARILQQAKDAFYLSIEQKLQHFPTLRESFIQPIRQDSSELPAPNLPDNQMQNLDADQVVGNRQDQQTVENSPLTREFSLNSMKKIKKDENADRIQMQLQREEENEMVLQEYSDNEDQLENWQNGQPVSSIDLVSVPIDRKGRPIDVLSKPKTVSKPRLFDDKIAAQYQSADPSLPVRHDNLTSIVTKLPEPGSTPSSEIKLSSNIDLPEFHQHMNQMKESRADSSYMDRDIVFMSFKERQRARSRMSEDHKSFSDQSSNIDDSHIELNEFEFSNQSEYEVPAKQQDSNNERNSNDIEANDSDKAQKQPEELKPKAEEEEPNEEEQKAIGQQKMNSEKIPCGQKHIKLCNYIVRSSLFNITIMVLILVNTYILASYTFEVSPEQTEFNQTIEYIFGAIFTIECLLKIAGFGIKNFVKDRFNILDAIIVIITVFQYIFEMYEEPDERLQVLELCKALRAIRLLKLARYNAEMRHLVSQTIKSLYKISGFCVILLLFMFIWALLGMEFFAYKAIMDENGNFIEPLEVLDKLEAGEITKIVYPRQNFNDIWTSLSSVFILITGEEWNIFMNMLVRIFDSGKSTGIPEIYCVIGIIVGNLTLIALFTGILCQTFSDSKRKKDQQQIDHENFWNFSKDGKKVKFSRRCCLEAIKRIYQSASYKENIEETAVKKSNQVQDAQSDEQSFQQSMPSSSAESSSMSNTSVQNHEDGLPQQPPEDGNNAAQTNNETQITLLHYNQLFEEYTSNEKSAIQHVIATKEEKIKGKSIGIFSTESKLRNFCWKLCQHKAFDVFIFLLILSSTVFITFDSPLRDPKNSLNQILSIASYVFVFFFVLEAIIKIIAFGLIKNGKRSYLRNNWNVLDFLIVISSLIDVSLQQSTNISVTRVFRSLRILRPIRIVARNQRLQVALTSFLKCLPKILKLQLLTLFLIFIIAIFQTNLFSGTFFRCYTEHLSLDINQRSQLILNKWQCLNYGGEWVRPDLNFDTIFDSVATLASINSMEGWTSVLWDIVDSKGIDQQPERDYRIVEGKLYTFAVMFFISLILVKLFVGVVVETFNRQKMLSSYNQVLKPAQRNYLEVLLLTFERKPLKKLDFSEMNWIRVACIKATQHKIFEIIILIAILSNTIVIGTYHFMITTESESTLNSLNIFFITLFTIEAIIKIIAQKKQYFADSWNRFDFLVLVLGYAVVVIMSVVQIKELKAILRVIRVLRIIKMLKLIKLVVNVKKMEHLQRTLADTAPVLGSFGLLLLLFIYMFTVIGVQLFALNSLEHSPGVNRDMNEQVNFQTFQTAFFTLFRCSTGESWNKIMLETSWQKSILYQCDPDETYEKIIEDGRDPQDWRGPNGCGQAFQSYFFFILFQFLITQVYLNLVIAIIVDAFTGILATEKLPINDKLIDEFVKQWSEYDPQATQFMPVHLMDKLLEGLSKSPDSRDLFIFYDTVAQSQKFRQRMTSVLEIPTFGNLKYVMFYDVLQMLCFRAFKMKYNKDTLKENFVILKVISKFQKKDLGSKLHQDAAEQSNLKTDYVIEFDNSTLKKFKKLNNRIELINKLRQKTILLQKQFAHFVDTTLDIGKKEEGFEIESLFPQKSKQKIGENPHVQLNLFTTKHYVAGLIILKYWREYQESKDENHSQRRIQAMDLVPES